jgi:thiol-disulfide isomerase/thioredoxin
MRLIFVIAFLCIVTLGLFAQHKVEGSLLGYDQKNISLLEYFGDKHRFVDSTLTDANGWFSFDLNKNTAPGLYSLAIGKNPIFNFIYNKEDITLKYEVGGNKLPEFIFSIENLIYYDYIVQSENFGQKSAMIIEILNYYPEKDSFYTYSEDHLHALQDEFMEYADRILKEYSHTLVSRIIKSDRPLMYPHDFNWSDLLTYNRQHFLNGVDFNDTILLNTNVLTGKAIDYMAFYSNSNMDKDMQEYYFMQAVDTILHKAMDNDRVYDFMMQYLIEGFDMYGFDKVISHIAENYEPANTCVNEDRKSELQKRVENLRRLAVGNQAPDVEIKKPDGTTFRIADIGSDLILVFFWASWCPHCEAMIPELKKIYADPSLIDFEVLSISIDTSAMDYSNSLASQASGWINYADFKGWDSQAAIDFSIYATPTMFLLNRDRSIIARPTSIIDLKNALINLQR